MSDQSDLNETNELAAQIAQYRDIVLRYEALDAEIDALIMTHEGSTEKMPPQALQRYRDLAKQRDALFSEMRAYEQLLQLDENQPE